MTNTNPNFIAGNYFIPNVDSNSAAHVQALISKSLPAFLYYSGAESIQEMLDAKNEDLAYCWMGLTADELKSWAATAKPAAFRCVAEYIAAFDHAVERRISGVPYGASKREAANLLRFGQPALRPLRSKRLLPA